MAVYFVRHGQTDWNLKGKIQGWADIDLNDAGRQQAKEAGGRLATISFEAIITSPLLRARKTAEIIAQRHEDTPLIVAPELKERDFGEFEGQINDGIYYGLWDYGKDVIARGETTEQLYGRASDFLDRMHEEYRDGDILLVAHGGIGVTIETYYRGIPEDGNLLTYASDNGEVRRYEKEMRES